MATVTVNGFDEVLKKLEKLSKKAEVDEIAKKAVNAAKDIVVNSTKSAVASSEGHRGGIGKRHRENRATNSVAGSISSTEAKINSYGAYSVARPTGRDRKGTSNGTKAALLEYGTSTMSARPWRGQAASSAEAPAKAAMEEVLQSEMELE